ncbi:hypothetical protein PAXRUDRAFT_833049 [Paxillus rubicundulus Ve08.2h10]|uniref:Uncharacterized protein n=1 Tax=Paxillus rubicundulus Ve08.2h10 TaxID=930991 RepID=A0A0D0CEK6_9AGAM|nr:hypothetical protein PAXRUDRAFT_833049 [Paxillus rubicundulus Ve08.2h10]
MADPSNELMPTTKSRSLTTWSKCGLQNTTSELNYGTRDSEWKPCLLKKLKGSVWHRKEKPNALLMTKQRESE